MIYIIHRTVYYIYGPNHAVKCYQDALEKLVAERPHYKGRAGEADGGNAEVSDNRNSLCHQNAEHRPGQTSSGPLLQQDLRNGPLHCFDIHTNCSTDYCKVTRSSQTPDTTNILIPEHVSSRGEENASLRRSLRLSTLSLRSCRPTLTRCWSGDIQRLLVVWFPRLTSW